MNKRRGFCFHHRQQETKGPSVGFLRRSISKARLYCLYGILSIAMLHGAAGAGGSILWYIVAWGKILLPLGIDRCGSSFKFSNCVAVRIPGPASVDLQDAHCSLCITLRIWLFSVRSTASIQCFGAVAVE